MKEVLGRSVERDYSEGKVEIGPADEAEVKSLRVNSPAGPQIQSPERMILLLTIQRLRS